MHLEVLTGHWLFPFVGFLVAMMTAFYMFRLVILTFHGEPRNKEKYDHAHESKFAMAMPLGCSFSSFSCSSGILQIP